MIIFLLCIAIIFCILLNVGIKKEWNGFLLICSTICFIPSLVVTLMLLFQSGSDTGLLFLSAIITAIFFIAIIKVLFRSRCPQCKKFFSAKKCNDEIIQHGGVYYKGTGDQRKAYQKNLYRRDYVCKHCNHEWSRNISREEEV